MGRSSRGAFHIKSGRDISFKELLNRYRSWWQDRILAGSQLKRPENYTEGWDYRGDGEWKTHVSIVAMRLDFAYDTGYICSTRTWRKMIKRVMADINIVNKHTVMPLDDDEGLVLGSSRRFVVFGKKPLTVMPM